MTTTSADVRLQQLQQWLHDHVKITEFSIAPASRDASFRRYFRVTSADGTRIVMDAPPDKEDCRPFIAVAQAMLSLGLNVPQIIEADLEQGFLLLSDLGSQQYLPALSESSVEQLYGDAMDALLLLQGRPKPADVELPPYDHALLWREMELFRDWFLAQHLGVQNDASHGLDETFRFLAAAALEQPRVWVHRDYHSRNLMLVTQGNPGILDFQDAVVGAVTYDLVSLLRDCYVAWPRQRVEDWVEDYRKKALAMGIIDGVDASTFLRWFDLMGVQRHLKAIGIFARLNHRDGKPGYLGDIPRTLGYVVDVAGRYNELAELDALIRETVLPRLDSRNGAAL